MRLPSPEHLWERHERYVLNIFLQALSKLRDEDSLPKGEIALNKLLYVNARQVWCDLPLNEKPASFSLVANSENSPRVKVEIDKEWTRKKPDFYWTLSNPIEGDPKEAIKDYTIECKRLHRKSANDLDFIRAYVVSGIIRYISKKHNYGIGTKSGAMIGYIQNMRHKEALEQVNAIIRKTKKFNIPIIEFDKNHQIKDDLWNGNHTLNRKEVDPSTFTLRHIGIILIS